MENIQEKLPIAPEQRIETPVAQPMPSSMSSSLKSTFFTKQIKILIGTVIGILMIAGSIVGYQKFLKKNIILYPAPTPQTLNIDNKDLKQYKNASALNFSFSYPFGWHVFNVHRDDQSYFYLDPEPIVVTTEYNAFLSGEGFGVQNETKLKEEIKSFMADNNNKNITELDWETGAFPGKCFKYDTFSDQYGEVKNNIECLVFIEMPKDAGYLPSQAFLYNFSVFNFMDIIKKIDPDLSIVKHFFSTLSPSL
ncbi:MAG: hypothetical protein AAB856_03670 [Patescibacteria group bacterium]